jgi:dephospho-CoA kinase
MYCASDRMPPRIGLTGGIGSGKSLVADLLAQSGAAVVDTDAIARELTAPGGAAIDAIRTRFGADMIDAHGALDRSRMRSLVFDDDHARAALEAILHPLIRQITDERAAAAPAAPYVLLAIPLLVEAGNWRDRVARVLVVDCPVALQIERVTRTRGLARTQVEAIIARQASRAQRLAAADDIVVNDGSDPRALAARLRPLHLRYATLGPRQPGAPRAL